MKCRICKRDKFGVGPGHRPVMGGKVGGCTESEQRSSSGKGRALGRRHNSPKKAFVLPRVYEGPCWSELRVRKAASLICTGGGKPLPSAHIHSVNAPGCAALCWGQEVNILGIRDVEPNLVGLPPPGRD